MERAFPGIPFAGHADEVPCHCTNQAQVQMLMQALIARMTDVGFELYPEKTWRKQSKEKEP